MKTKKYKQNLNQFQVSNSGPYFYGDLISGIILETVAKQKSKSIKKEENFGKALEDEVWLIFKKFGFIEMNRDRNFKIKAGSCPKQIDVYAKDEHNVFVIFCTSQQNKGPSKSLNRIIREISDLKKDISMSIKNHYKKKFRISFFLVTRNIVWNETQENLASEKQIFYWRDSDLEAYRLLAEQLGYAAKYQMYSILFPRKKASEVGEIKVPAMWSGKGKYYCFLIHPKDLFKIAYVHRREKSNPDEIGSTYQRMVNKKRIEDIGKYIDDGHSFPNNIIIAFKSNIKKPRFDPHPKVEEISGISYGILTFPPYYGCAWIIDGQHRLYGYCKSKHIQDNTIPVIAYESLDPKEQANLFVDINREQKAVRKNLLWDLYPDIYEGSEDEKQQLLRAISLTAKKINSDKNSPLKGEIKIPSLVKNKEKANLTLENVCRAIKDNKLLDEEGGILYEKTYENTINLASKIIENYFEEIKKSFNKEWELGKKGMIKSNVGIRIFVILLRQALKYFVYKGEENIYKIKDLRKFKQSINSLFTPLRKKLGELSEWEKRQIRTSSGGAVSNNAKQMAWWVKEEFDEFGLEILKDWAPPRPKEITDSQIRKLLEDTEKNLRAVIIKKLREKYLEKWWKQGIPRGVKEEIGEKIEKESKGESQQRKKELLSLSSERKFKGYSYTHHLRETIMAGNNWNFFKDTFIKDKDYTYAMFKSFEKVRHKYQHFAEHELYEDEKNLGFWAMKWIRRYVGLDIPKRITFSI